MTTTVASTWQVYGDEFCAPGSAINDRSDSDLGAIAAMLHRLKAQGRVLAYGGFGYTSNAFRVDRPSNEAGQTTYRVCSRGDFFWRGTRLSAKLHVYGQNVLMQAIVDGTMTISATAGGTLGFGSSSTTTATISPGADGEVEFYVQVQQDGSSGTREWYGWVLEATDETVYGDYDDYTGAFQQMDSASFDPDGPLTGWHLSTFERNIRDLQRSKPRGVCHCYAEANATNTTDAVTQDVLRIGSVFAKAEGPYTVYAPPWATEVDVFLRCAQAITGRTSTVSVMTDQDNPADNEAIWGSRASDVSSTSHALLKWTLPVACASGSYTPIRVWILHTGDAATSAADSYLVDEIDATGVPHLHTTTPEPGSPHDGPYGLCLGMPEPTADGTIKASYGFNGVENYLDFAGVVDTGEVSTPTNMRIVTSPPPTWQNVWASLGEAAGGSSETISEYFMAALRIYGVYVGAKSGEAAISTTETRAAAQVDAIPSGIRMSQVVARVNEMALFATPQIASRTIGQRWLRGEESATPNGRFASSPWSFTQLGGTTWMEIATWIVPASVTAGGDIDAEELTASFYCAAFLINGAPRDFSPTATIEARLVCNGVTGSTFSFPVTIKRTNSAEMLRGEWDAAQAGKFVGRDAVNPSDPVYNNAYTQQYEWYTERIGGLEWYRKSPAIKVTSPAATPALCRLEVRSTNDADPLLAVMGGVLYASRRR